MMFLRLVGAVPKVAGDLGDRPQPRAWSSKMVREGPENGPEEPRYRPQNDLRTVPIEIHIEAQEALREALELSREQREDRLEAERRAEEAEERALRIARQAQALAEELGTQKRLLAENAESLVERHAKLQEYQARADEAMVRQTETQTQLEELYRHNAEEKARYERERDELLDKLKQSETKASQLDRLPRWVTKIFGAKEKGPPT